MTYNPGQFNVIKDFVTREPEWLILGGPSDGDEAQCARNLWPKLHIIGVEPVLDCISWQFANDWPKDALLLPFALSETCGRTSINITEDLRSASLMPDRPGITQEVSTVTIDRLNKEYGPFQKAILWLDIEGYEYEALQGARKLFNAEAVDIVNVEILHRRPESTADIEDFFAYYNFSLVHIWNDQAEIVQDRIYRRNDA